MGRKPGAGRGLHPVVGVPARPGQEAGEAQTVRVCGTSVPYRDQWNH